MTTKLLLRVGLAQNAAKASNAFASDLFRVFTEGGSSNNIFFSPMSISAALAMTFMGARGETATQMSQALHFNSLEESALHHSFADLSALLYRAEAPYTLKAANKLFGNKDLDFLATFAADTKKYYGASLETLEFSGDGGGSRQHINSWVEKRTANRISEFLTVGAIGGSTRSVLANALYFKGEWDSQFEHRLTLHDNNFHTASGPLNVPMMHKRGKFNYARDDSVSCSILELPYIEKEVSMFVVLPDEVDGLAGVQKKLSQEKIDSWVAEARKSHSPTVIVSLPKFTLEQDVVLSEVLSKMGMPDAFDQDRADFSGMTGGKDLCLPKVFNKAFLDVNEEGSEAAAATTLRREYNCTELSPISGSKEFRANRSFLFFIYDNKTGAVMFIGQLCQPKQ